MNPNMTALNRTHINHPFKLTSNFTSNFIFTELGQEEEKRDEDELNRIVFVARKKRERGGEG